MVGWLDRVAGGLPRTFWYLFAGTLINRTGSFVTLYLAIYLTLDRGESVSFAGLVVGLSGAGGTVGVLIGGQLADQWGRRATLLLANVCSAVLLVTLGFTDQHWAIAIEAAALGLFQTMPRPAYSAMMVDIVPDADRLRTFSLNYWAINLGFSLSALLAGLVAELDYLLLFLLDASTTLVAALIIFFLVPETRPAAGRRPHTGKMTRPGPATDMAYVSFVGLTFLTALVYTQSASTLPLAMGDDGLSARTYGMVIALNGVLIVVGQLFVPKLVGRRDSSHVLAVAALIIGVGFGLTAFAHTALMYALTVLIWTAGEMLQSPSSSTLIAKLSPADMRGRYQGLFSLAFSAAAFIAPIMGGFALQHLGARTVWLGCLGISVLTAVGNLVAAPSRHRRTAQLAQRDELALRRQSAYDEVTVGDVVADAA